MAARFFTHAHWFNKMATRLGLCGLKTNQSVINPFRILAGKFIHTSPVCSEVQSGKVKVSPKGDKRVDYERSFRPHHIGHRKSWNTWNTTTLKGGLRAPETATDDMFIRKFMEGTFHGCLCSDIIIKRQHNIIRIAVLVYPRVKMTQIAFLIGYTEELLGYWLQCIVKLELQIINHPFDTTFKFV